MTIINEEWLYIRKGGRYNTTAFTTSNVKKERKKVMPENIHGTLAVIGIGLVTLGAAYGIGKIAAAAVEGIARQPEAAAKIQTTMLIAAALIEGIALFGAVICFIAINT